MRNTIKGQNYGFKYLLLFVFYFVLTLVIYLPLILAHHIPSIGDSISRLNVFGFSNIALKDGEFPFWNDYLNIGRNYSSDLSNELFYPVKFVFSFLPPLVFIYFYYAFHTALNATFFALFLREIKCSEFVSNLFSFAYFFSVFMGGFRSAHLLLFACMAYLPVIMYFVQCFINTQKRRYLYASSIFMAIQFLIEFPQLALYTDILVGIYLVIFLFINRRGFKKGLVDLISWAGLYFGLITIKAIPYYLYSKELSEKYAEKITINYFMSWSTSLRDLLRLLSPKILPILNGDPMSSEFPWEIFFGSIALCLAVYGITYILKNKKIGIYLLLFILPLVYTILIRDETTAAFVYKIPFIKEFRCSSRILFAVEFFGMVLAAIGLEELLKRKTYKRFILILSIDFVATAVCSLIYRNEYIKPKELIYRTPFYSVRQTLLCLVIGILVSILLIRNKKREKFAITVIAFSIALELFPLWSHGNTFNMKSYGISTPAEEYVSSLDTNDKLFTTSYEFGGNYSHVIGYNDNIQMHVAALNSYTNLNNPELSILLGDDIDSVQLNEATRFTAFTNMNTILTQYNDILSCLGIRYIIDENNVLSDDFAIYNNNSPVEVLYEADEILVNNDSENYAFIPLESDTIYRVSFDCNDEAENDSVYWDFYGGPDYDLKEQQRSINFIENKHHYVYYIDSGDTSLATLRTCFRVIGNTNTTVTLRNVQVSKLLTNELETPYRLIYTNNGIDIYENINYREILYVPTMVSSVTSDDELFFNKGLYDFDDISYIEDANELVTADTTITNIDHHHNYTTATVSSSDDTFVTFSQTYDNGWRAYIDGQKVTVHKVNGYIQGIYVPAGTHEIKFSYLPVGFIPALVIESITIIAVTIGYIVMFINNKKKNKKLSH